MTTRKSALRLASVVLALGLWGCASGDAAWVHENLEHTENFHAGTSVLETPGFPDTGPHHATLRATARTRGTRIGADIELAVRAEFRDYSFLDRVSFSSGRAFPLTVEKREVEDCGTSDPSLCNVHEFVSVKLSREFLKAKRTTGFSAKLWGRRDSVVIDVPPEYIEGLLARMENRAPVSPSQGGTTGPVPAAKAP
jgi:hypothetical protein